MRILIIDDDKMICHCLKTIIEADNELEVVAIGHCYDDAVRLYEEKLPELCLFDISIGEKSGIDALKAIRAINSEAKILFLTTFLQQEYIDEAIRLNSNGYILKDDYENIVFSIKSVFAGQCVFSNNVVGQISPIKSEKNNKNIDCLSNSEKNILELVAKGYSNKEIAENLFLSEGTVRNYISTMLEKLDLRDRTNLAIFYLNKS